MDEQTQLDQVAKEIIECPICPVNKVGLAVPGEGSAEAKVVFLGEAPGKEEAKTGRPFIGRSGKLLRKLIEEVGLKEREVFITSPVKYLPVYVTPKPADVVHGKTHTLKQLKIINPNLIVLLGSTAALAMLGEKLPVMKMHGQVIIRDDFKFFLTIHPAAAIRFQKNLQIIEEDFKLLRDLLNKAS